MSSKKEALIAFNKLLKEYGVFEFYYDRSQVLDREMKFKHSKLNDAIWEGGFSWKQSDRKYEFWSGLNSKWQDICKQKDWTDFNLLEVLSLNTFSLDLEKSDDIKLTVNSIMNEDGDVVETLKDRVLGRISSADVDEDVQLEKQLFDDMVDKLFEMCKREIYENIDDSIHDVVNSIVDNIPELSKVNIVRDYIKTL